jgi:hypothetical protein
MTFLGLTSRFMSNSELAASIAHRLYRLPTAGFGLQVVAVKRETPAPARRSR